VQAWKILTTEKSKLIRRAFERTGCLVTTDGSEDQKIHLEGLTAEETQQALAAARARLSQRRSAQQRQENKMDQQRQEINEADLYEEQQSEEVTQEEAVSFALLAHAPEGKNVDPSMVVEADPSDDMESDPDPDENDTIGLYEVLGDASLDPQPSKRGKCLVGRQIVMLFSGFGWAKGTIKKYHRVPRVLQGKRLAYLVQWEEGGDDCALSSDMYVSPPSRSIDPEGFKEAIDRATPGQWALIAL
jgi:hypothetical protein